ncbi:hypothetical protein LOTGIDRAFT_230045 [Lottia gigantea]|uniref:Uncharacterized protein n=1 Tax=Lottia gigantea TaxID=225164 RepID=V4BBP0_LOTGI|nr:hypothetical protein LOTGIDRAFT_230045 [Lottia gigantea]ESP05001.1 hypothetical protein LOTGIDRAFT_230045 [Lottia gigantea]
MPRMGDDLITMKFKMFQQLASIEQFEQHRAEEQGLPAGPKYPFSPQWLLDNPDEFMAIDATVEYPSQEEGSSEDETSPNTSKVESEDTKSYEDDFTSEDESEDDEDGDDDSYDDDEDDDDSDDGDDDSSSSTPRSSSDEQYSSSDDCRTTVEESQEKNLEAEQSHNDNLTPMHTNCACGKRSDTETSEENNGYEQNVVAQPWDYEEDVDEGEDQKEVSERNSTTPSDEVLSNQRRILKEGKGLNEKDVSERLIEMHKCWKRVKKIEVVSTKYPRRRSTSPVLPVQETLRVEEEQRIQREYEYDSETPVILRVAYGQKVYHLKLKNCTICSLEFDAFVPHQESLRTVGAAASKIPIRTKLSPVLPRHDRGYTKDDYVFGKGLSHLAYRYLRIVVKIHGKRLAIPIDLEKDRKMVRDFIRNPRSSLLTDPPGLGQFILDKAMAILQERPQWRFCGKHVDEQLKYHKWFSQCNASTETETSSPKTQDAASNVSFGSEGEEDHIEEQGDEEEEDQESDEEPEVQPARPQRMPLPDEEMQEPEPFTDDLYAERTEQLLAERAEKERKVKAVQQAGKSNHHVRKTFADKFTFIQEKYFCPNPSRRQFNERKYNIGFVPKNEKWIQVDVDADLAKEHIRKEDLIDAHAYPIQPENYDIGTYRMDECVAVQKAKKGHLEGLGGKQKVKTRGIPNKHLEKHYFEKELKNLEKDEEENADEEETVFGNPEINEITEPKPIFVETGSPELDMRHIEDKPCKVLQKRPTAANPPTPSKNKNRKKRHRTTSGANPGAAIAPTNLAESLFDFSHSKPNRAKKR